MTLPLQSQSLPTAKEQSLIVSPPTELSAGTEAEAMASEAKLTRRAHEKCLGAERRSIDWALEAGRSLLRQKCLLVHGNWSQHVRKAYRGAPSLRMAQKYMLLAEHWEALAAKTNCSSLLSLQDAFRRIAQMVRENASQLALVDASRERPQPLDLGPLVTVVLGKMDRGPFSRAAEDPVSAQLWEHGLNEDWHGRLCLRPPQGRELASWIAKLKANYPACVTEALVLLPPRTDTAGFLAVSELAACLAFLKTPLRAGPEGDAARGIVAYLGDRVATFVEVFDEHALLLFPRP